MNNTSNKIKAFTLIELLVVIAIIGILSGVVIIALMEIYKASNNGDYSGIDSDPDASLLIADIIDQGGGTPPVDPCASIAQGGEWIDSGLGFCVMKYEAKNEGGLATSQASGDPWVSINQTAAISACQAIGANLITNAQWTALARNIEGVSSNWSNGAVGNGVLARGWAAYTSYGDSWTNSGVASSTGPSCLYNTGANACGSTGTHLYKRTHTLSNGETIWDLSGNVWEWNSDTCSQTNWYNNGAWIEIEWDNSNLSDYEKPNAGPSGAFTSSHGAGRYYGCTANGNGFFRGGYWYYGASAGVFALDLRHGPTVSGATIGFRCTVTP